MNWIRSELTRQIAQPLTVGSTLIVHLLAPGLEARVAASDATPLSDSDRQQLVQLILAARRAQASGPMIVLTSLDVKRRLRRLIVDELPEVRVIAYQELDLSRTSCRTAHRRGRAALTCSASCRAAVGQDLLNR